MDTAHVLVTALAQGPGPQSWPRPMVRMLGLPFPLTWGPEELPSHLDSGSEVLPEAWSPSQQPFPHEDSADAEGVAFILRVCAFYHVGISDSAGRGSRVVECVSCP